MSENEIKFLHGRGLPASEVARITNSDLNTVWGVISSVVGDLSSKEAFLRRWYNGLSLVLEINNVLDEIEKFLKATKCSVVKSDDSVKRLCNTYVVSAINNVKRLIDALYRMLYALKNSRLPWRSGSPVSEFLEHYFLGVAQGLTDDVIANRAKVPVDELRGKVRGEVSRLDLGARDFANQLLNLANNVSFRLYVLSEYVSGKMSLQDLYFGVREALNSFVDEVYRVYR